LQKSPSTDSSSKEITNESKEMINQTVSTIIHEQEPNVIKRNEESTPDLLEERKAMTPVTPSSGLNPEAAPFFVRSSSKIGSTHSTSTGNESDDENDSKETPITSGK
jgi:hypothetical protein